MLLGSGTGAAVGTIAIPSGPSRFVISDAFTEAPEVVYSPIVLPLKFATNRSEPSTAMPSVPFDSVTSEAFTVASEVVYSPIPLTSVTNRSEPDTATLVAPLSPEISEAFTVAPAVVYSPIVPLPLFTTGWITGRSALIGFPGNATTHFAQGGFAARCLRAREALADQVG